MKTILVTGGAGYVGSHCCKAFSRAGWNVVVFDSLAHGWRDFVRWGPLVQGDIRDRAALEAAMVEHRPDVVAHFAALISVGESVVDPAAHYSANTIGAFTLLEAMRARSVPSLIFSSTAAVYGEPQTTPISEDHRLLPINPYGRSKLAVEGMMADYAAAYSLRYAALRYFNAAGADPEGELGERHEPETHLIPLAIRGLMDPAYRLNIFGNDYPTRDGTCVRDYVHVHDLGRAHLSAAERLFAGGDVGPVNLGTGEGATVNEVAVAVEAAAGRSLTRVLGPRRPGDPPALVASNARARHILSWVPERSTIATIVHDAWAWHQQPKAIAPAGA